MKIFHPMTRFAAALAVSIAIGDAARSETVSLHYYYPACPSWLFPIAREFPSTCPQKVDPACAPGQACKRSGAQCLHVETFCDGMSVERRISLCLPQQPEPGRAGCPISSAVHKTGIRYLNTSDRQKVAHQILDLKLATYHYKPGSEEESGSGGQLGFIIEDLPADSAFVVRESGRVNLYGLTAGSIAAIQQLEGRLRGQQLIIEELKNRLDLLEGGAQRPLAPGRQ